MDRVVEGFDSLGKRRAVRTFSTTKRSRKSNLQPEISASEAGLMVRRVMKKKSWVSFQRIVRWSGLSAKQVRAVLVSSPLLFVKGRFSGCSRYRLVRTED